MSRPQLRLVRSPGARVTGLPVAMLGARQREEFDKAMDLLAPGAEVRVNAATWFECARADDEKMRRAFDRLPSAVGWHCLVQARFNLLLEGREAANEVVRMLAAVALSL